VEYVGDAFTRSVHASAYNSGVGSDDGGRSLVPDAIDAGEACLPHQPCMEGDTAGMGEQVVVERRGTRLQQPSNRWQQAPKTSESPSGPAARTREGVEQWRDASIALPRLDAALARR
jgi:hypothetical protein